jgi:hypothetical protein
MKSDTPSDRQDNFVVLYQSEKELKRLVGFEQQHSDDAYVLLLAPGGEIHDKMHGAVSDAGIARIKAGAGNTASER